MKTRYYIKTPAFNWWREVTVKEFCTAERLAGFRSKRHPLDSHYRTTPATNGFSANGYEGKVEYDIQKYCIDCCNFKPLNQFYMGGEDTYCKECRKARSRKNYYQRKKTSN